MQCFVERLFDCRQTAAVSEWMSEVVIADDSLRPFLTFRNDKHARNLVLRTERFDVIVLCWRPGHYTEIHDHDGQCGWSRVLRGRLEETVYARAPRGTEPTEAPCPLLVRRGSAVVSAGPTVLTVDCERAIHRLGNPAEHCDDEDAVSLHVHSFPHDARVVFDPARGSARRADSKFDTIGGVSWGWAGSAGPPTATGTRIGGKLPRPGCR